jgi:hypothetical protein
MQAQQLSLNYHFNCEQRVCFATGTYFGFNGEFVSCAPHPSSITLSAMHWSGMCLVDTAAKCTRCCPSVDHNLLFELPGTGGIWRRTCIENIGGWNHRTTVEDMDLSLRCHLAGWKCIYVNDVTSWNEVRCHDMYVMGMFG